MTATTPAQDAAALARITRISLIAAVLSDEFGTMDERLDVVAAVVDAADVVAEAITTGLNPHPHGVICPVCGKWSDHPRNTCVEVTA